MATSMIPNILMVVGDKMNVPLSPIEAHEQTLARIFSDAYAFEIPPYQRPYAWELEQTRQLLNDLVEEMDSPIPGGGTYFLGSVVLIKPPADPKSQVVDGQQRLTTLTILLSVLRDLTADPEQRSARAVRPTEGQSGSRH
jgi:uncharacterized protein with ParB-like and HNH nuclease domain